MLVTLSSTCFGENQLLFVLNPSCFKSFLRANIFLFTVHEFDLEEKMFLCIIIYRSCVVLVIFTVLTIVLQYFSVLTIMLCTVFFCINNMNGCNY